MAKRRVTSSAVGPGRTPGEGVFVPVSDDAGEDDGYVLTYAPRDYRLNGSTHLVSLKTSRKGIRLRYRPAYVADTSSK